MSNSSDKLSYLIKRRRALALASTAISIAGCGMPSISASAPSPAPATDPRAAEAKVKAYTSDIEMALDKIDRERLRAAALRKPGAPEQALPQAETPAEEPDASVILASAGAHAPAAGHAPAPAPTTHAPAPAPAAHAPESHEPVAAAPAPVAPSRTASPASVHASESALLNPPEVTETIIPPTTPNGVPTKITVAKPDPISRAVAEKPVPPAVPEAKSSQISADTKTEMPSAVIKTVAAPTPTPAAAMGSMNAVASAVGSTGALPAATANTTPAEPSVEDALAILKKNVNTHPTLSTALAMALLDGSTAGDMAKGLSESDQKVFSDLFGALDAMKTGNSATSISDRTAPLVSAAKRWAAGADLSLPRLVLASRVDSFGVYTPVSTTFEQGKRHTVIIYCEVANFACKKGDDGWFSTHLTQQETLMTDDNLLVWRPNAEDVEDRSMNQRNDFYLVKKLTIPENLATGKYTLVMNVADKISGKKNIVTLPIEIK